MLVCWGISVRQKNLGYVDVGWVVCTTINGLLAPMTGLGSWGRRTLLAWTLILWGGRLGWLLIRRLSSQSEEEFRYREFRTHLGAKPSLKIFLFFQLQGILAVVLTQPMRDIASAEGAWTLLELLGFLLFFLGYAGEATADWQLRLFKLQGGGPVCKEGLWRYSRHPNYFFEFLLWLGWSLWAFSLWGHLTAFISAAIMLGLLTSVTGVPPAERSSLRRCPQEYRQYQKETRAFFPWFVRSV